MKIDWFTFAAQVVNFLLLVYLLKRFLYAPINAAMQRREDQIAERVGAAERSQQDAERLIDEYQRRTEELDHQRHRMFEEVKNEVDVSRQQMLKQARGDVQNRRDDWLASLHRERETLSQLVKQRCSDQVTAATRQAIRQLADVELEEQMLRSFIRKLDNQELFDRAQGPSIEHGAQVTVHSAFEIPALWHQRLKDALQQHLHVHSIEFRIDPSVVCGLEVHFGSQKIGWSVEEYLTKLEEQFRLLVQHPTP